MILEQRLQIVGNFIRSGHREPNSRYTPENIHGFGQYVVRYIFASYRERCRNGRMRVNNCLAVGPLLQYPYMEFDFRTRLPFPNRRAMVVDNN